MGSKLITTIWNGLREYLIDPVVKNFIKVMGITAANEDGPNANPETQKGSDVVKNTTKELKISGGKEAEIGCINRNGTNSNPGIPRHTENAIETAVIQNVEKVSFGCN